MNQLREEILISKAVGGDASPLEWDELVAMAQHAPDLWRQLAGCLRDERAFEHAISDAGALAETIEIPGLCSCSASLPRGQRGPGILPRGLMLGILPRGQRGPGILPGPRQLATRWLGWAVAAAVALTWTAGTFQQGRLGAPRGDAAQTASLANVPAADLLRAYLDNGRQEQRVIGELPERVVVESRPAPAGGGYELLFVRQIIEREVVPQLYQPAARDDGGRVMLVRYPGPPRPPM